MTLPTEPLLAEEPCGCIAYRDGYLVECGPHYGEHRKAEKDNPYGPSKPCRRTACIDSDPDGADRDGDPVAAHLGGAHLDPRSPLYDGPHTLVGVMPYAVRDAVHPLIHATRDDLTRRRVADVAIEAACTEIDRLRQQVAHVRVDADHRIIRESKRVLDCGTHGEMIRDLEAQVQAFDKSADRSEKGRLSLLGGMQGIRDFLDAYGQKKSLGLPTPDADTIVEALGTYIRKSYAAHERAWK